MRVGRWLLNFSTRRAVGQPDWLVERTEFELPSLVIAALLCWSAAFSLLRLFRHRRGLAKLSLSEEHRSVVFAQNSRTHHRRHADVTGLRGAIKAASSLPAGLRPRSTTAQSKGLEGSNPVRSTSQTGFCAALP